MEWGNRWTICALTWCTYYSTAHYSYSYGLAAGAKFCAFWEDKAVRRHLIFFNWLLSVIGTGCLVLERVQFALRGYQLYTRIKWHIFWYIPYFVRLNGGFWNYLTASRELQWVLNQRIINEWFHIGWYHILEILLWKPKKVTNMTIITFLACCPADKKKIFFFSFFVRFSTKKDLWFFRFSIKLNVR